MNLAVVLAVAACGGGGKSSSDGARKAPPPVFEDGNCTATSKPAAHYGHCIVPFADKGNICVHFTGANGKNTDDSKALCADTLKGTYADGECPPSTTGQCLKRCGLPYETLETIMFATAPDWEKACAAAKGTYTAPSI